MHMLMVTALRKHNAGLKDGLFIKISVSKSSQHYLPASPTCQQTGQHIRRG